MQFEVDVETNDKGEFVPYLAKSVTNSPDFQTWTVELRDGKVLVNGRVVDFPEIVGASVPQAPRITYPFKVPAGAVWTMGDNRLASSDSRSFGPVPVENIIGKVIVRFWPIDHVALFGW